MARALSLSMTHTPSVLEVRNLLGDPLGLLISSSFLTQFYTSSEYELERRKLEILGRLSEQYAALGPQLKDMGLYISELKQYLQV